MWSRRGQVRKGPLCFTILEMVFRKVIPAHSVRFILKEKEARGGEEMDGDVAKDHSGF